MVSSLWHNLTCKLQFSGPRPRNMLKKNCQSHMSVSGFKIQTVKLYLPLDFSFAHEVLSGQV